MVSAVVLRCKGKRVAGVAGGLVEVDDAVEDAAGVNPGVDGLANLLALVGEVTRALVWGDSGAKDLDSVLMGAGCKLAQALLKVFRSEVVIGPVWLVEHSDIVD